MPAAITNANLGLRFLLEIAALVAISVWGFHAGDGLLMSALLGVGVPVIAAAIWGVFRLPNDPGDATVPVPGPVRFVIELLVWSGATAALILDGRPALALTFAALVVISNALMPQRLRRLLSER